MRNHLRIILTICIVFIIQTNAVAQSLGVNTTGAPAANSAILDVSSTDKGMLVPRMSKTERNAIVLPATGLMVFQNAPDSIGFYYYDGTVWQWLASSKSSVGWLTTGNASTTIAANFFGTTDNIPLSFRQNNKWLGRWNSTTNNYLVGDSAGSNITSGLNNIGIGSKALLKNTTAYANIAIGNAALQNNVTALRNTVVGDSAMFYQSYNPGGNYFQDNTAIGSKAMINNQPTATNNGTKNTAIGSEAMYANTTGAENTAVGVGAFRENTTGAANTVVGRSANRLAQIGVLNSYFGYSSGYADSTSSNNTGLGAYSLYNHQRNGLNTAVGFETMEYDSAGSQNTAIGWRALRNNKTGVENTALGVGALEYDSIGNYNTGVGRYAGFGTRTGHLNIWMGYQSGMAADTAQLTTSIGTYSGYYNKMDYTTAFGAYSLVYNSQTAANNTQGAENTGLGYGTSYLNRTGSKNVAVGYQAMNGNGVYGSYNKNIAVGDSALFSINSGNSNIGIGFKAVSNTRTGTDNIAIGDQALNANVSGSQNVAIGSRALINAVSGYPNTAVGYSSQDSATTGGANTSLGSFSLTKNKGGYNNTAIGNAAMFDAYNPSTANYPFDNTAVGNDALRFTRYYGQVALGAGALRNDTSGSYNTAAGYLAMYQNLSGIGNVSVGTVTMYKNKGSSYNTAVGFNSLYNHNTSNYDYNTALGSFALEQDTTGFQNTGVGTSAFRSNVSGIYNTGVGINAGYYQKESVNTFVGAYAGVGERSPYNNYAADTGNLNTGMGGYALYKLANGDNNVALGYNALYSDSSGAGNVAIGSQSLNVNTTGNLNTAIGFNTNVSGNNLTNASAIGASAYIAQSNSMVLGSIAGINSAGTTAAIGIGVNTPAARLHIRKAGASGGTYHGSSSLIIEDNANSYVQFSNPTANETGFLSGNAATIIRSAIIFRADSSLQLRTGGNFTQATISNTGNFGIGTITPLTKLHISESTAANVNLRISSANTSWEPGLELTKGSGGVDWKIYNSTSNLFTLARSTDDFVTPTDYYEWSTGTYRPVNDATVSLGQSTFRWTTVYATVGAINTSDARDKENISNLNYGLKEVMKLRPVTFTWKENPQWGKKIGFIAQEVQPILNEVVQVGDLKTKDDKDRVNNKNDKFGIYYSDIIPVTVKAIQEQETVIEDQAKEIATLKEKNAQLEKDIQLIKEKLGIKN